MQEKSVIDVTLIYAHTTRHQHQQQNFLAGPHAERWLVPGEYLLCVLSIGYCPTARAVCQIQPAALMFDVISRLYLHTACTNLGNSLPVS